MAWFRLPRAFPSWFARCGSVRERCVGVGEAFGGGGDGFVDDGISRGRAGAEVGGT